LGGRSDVRTTVELLAILFAMAAAACAGSGNTMQAARTRSPTTPNESNNRVPADSNTIDDRIEYLNSTREILKGLASNASARVIGAATYA
jgi:hypothetical protein